MVLEAATAQLTATAFTGRAALPVVIRATFATTIITTTATTALVRPVVFV